MVTTAANEYREEYEVREGDIITSPGKFEGEHISVPYFWDCASNGDCEIIWDFNIPIYFMVIGESEREDFPDLKDRYGVALYETETGFINAVWFDSRADYKDAQMNPDEVC